MKNYIQSGDTMDVVLATDAEPGDIIVVGGLVGVLVNGGKAGSEVAAKRRGAYWYPKAVGAVGQGDSLYLAADNALTKTEQDNAFIGHAFADAAAADPEVMFVLKA